MIGYLKGRVVENEGGKLIVALDSANGAVGYSVTIPQSAAYGLVAAGTSVELFVYTHVREDQLDLYGFMSRQEKEIFLTLLGVNGIGPKGALGILSGAGTVEELIAAILRKDKDFLTQIPGVGKKTAERIVLELAEPLRKKSENVPALFKNTGTGATAADNSPNMVRDAKVALLGLGYRDQDVNNLLNRIMNEDSAPKRVEDLIRTALQQLA